MKRSALNRKSPCRRLHIACVVLAASLLLPRPLASADAETGALKKSRDFRKLTAKVLKKMPLAKGYHEGLFWDDGKVWVANGRVPEGANGNIWVIDTLTGKMIREIEPVAAFTEGVAEKSGGTFFITDWETHKLYEARVEGNRMVPQRDVASFEPAHPAGVAWNGIRLFVITWTRGMGTKFHLLEMDENANVIRKMLIKYIQEPCQLAWDGKNLWITSWFNRKVYKVDVDSMEIVGSFIHYIPRATGIAWDGKCFWLTGTKAGLYQLEVSE